MKRISKYLLFLASAIAVVTGCTMADMNPELEYRTAFGTLGGTIERPKITLDNNTVLYVDQIGPLTSWEEVGERLGRRERIYVNYTVYSVDETTVPKSSSICLNRFYSILVKDIERLSTMSDDRRAELGNDPIGIKSANIGGGYVNLSFSLLILPADPEYPHTVDLVLDDESYNDGDIHLVLYHNGDPSVNYRNGKEHTSWASFAITDGLIPNASTIKLYWRWYDNDGNVVEHEDVAVFDPYATIRQSQQVGDQPWLTIIR